MNNNLKNLVKNFFIKYKFQTIFALVVIIWALYSYAKQEDDLKENGILVEGTIIECKMVKLNTACFVKVEYYTLEGEKRICNNTLNNHGNCVLGKKVKLIYSSKSDLVDVFD